MHPWKMIALLVSGGTISSCANSPISPAAPPRIEMPAAAMKPCSLFRLPEHATAADLDLGYATRGADLVTCDAARRLAVETWAAEHKLQDRRFKPARKWFRWWFN